MRTRRGGRVWSAQAPLQWDVKDPYPVAKTAVALLRDYMPKVTGETIHVDGGYHAMGAELPPPHNFKLQEAGLAK